MSAGRAGTAGLALCAAICAALAAAPAAGAQDTFPPTPVGASSANESIVLANFDPEPVTLEQPDVSGQDAAAFARGYDSCTGATLAYGDECYVTISFRPARAGTHAATLRVPVQGDPEAPFIAELSGEGIQALRVSPALIDFGSVFAFSEVGQDVLVENVSGQDIANLSARIVPATARSLRLTAALAPTRCGVELAAGASCHLRVTFRPRVSGPVEARLVFPGPYAEMGSVGLRGTGAPRPPSTTPRPTPVRTPIRFHTPNATAVLRKRLRAALVSLRGRSREALLKRGLVIRGIFPPAQGVLRVGVDARRPSRGAIVEAAKGRLPVQAGRRVALRARLTRAGRRLLRSGSALRLDVTLTLVAQSDNRLSRATSVLRLGRAPQPAREPRSP
jgi:hypothetical protein